MGRGTNVRMAVGGERGRRMWNDGIMKKADEREANVWQRAPRCHH